MAEGGDKPFFGVNEEDYFTCFDGSVSQSCSRRHSLGSGVSLDSSGIGTLGQSLFILSPTGSELSIRTGSVAYNRLPPRPAPPLPPPKPLRLTPRKPPSPPSSAEHASPSRSPLTNTHRPKSVKKFLETKPQIDKKPSFCKKLPPEKLQHWECYSEPDEDLSITFSSNTVQHILNSIPPSYPPPLPPESLPEIPPRPPNNLLAALLPTAPLLVFPETPERSPTPTLNRNSYIFPEDNTYQYVQQTRKACCSRIGYLTFLTIISLTLSLACCGCLAFVFMYFMENQTMSKVCLQLQKGSEKMYGFPQNLTGSSGSEDCTAALIANSNMLMEMMSNQTRSRDKCSPLGFVSAHYNFHPDSGHNCTPVESKNRQLIILSSKENSSNLKQNRGGLLVLHSGLYFVYASISFRPHYCSGLHESNRKSEFFIYQAKQSNDQGLTLLAQANHVCAQSCSNDFHTSFTGGIFQLKKEDIILVKVTSPQLVLVDGQASFVGMVMVGASDP